MSKIVTLSIDAMGGDAGLDVTIPGALHFLHAQKTNFPHRIILVGDQDKIMAKLREHQGIHWLEKKVISIHHASEVVEMDEPPVLALKKKKNSSMRLAINLVKEAKANACISAGNTGALMATAKFVLKTIKGIERPAFCSTLPCVDSSKVTYMLDLGANVDSSAQILTQFAAMASALTQSVDGRKAPSVALLNVGAEEIKGSQKVKATSKLLSESTLNYVGYIESDEIYYGKVDVIVCDGFEGNIALKASEGVAKMFFKLLREEFSRSIWKKFTAFLAKPVFSKVYSRIDPRIHNGATLLGLNGVVVKSHGGADAIGFAHAIDEACLQSDRDVTTNIRASIENLFSH